MSVEKLKNIRNKIENLDKNNHIDILKILINKNFFINENKNGVFINLSEIPNDIVVKLEEYIKYINEQKEHLECIEKQKNELESKYFKDNKETL